MRKLADIERERALNDDDSDPQPVLPHGAKNYITPAGYAVLSAEYRYHIGRGRSIQEKPGTFMGQPFRYAPQEAYGRTDWDVVPKVFIDAGWTNHNIRQATNETDASLLSAGVGVDVFLKQNVSLRLDYGFALRDYHSPGNSTGVSAGDGRLHFALTVQY